MRECLSHQSGQSAGVGLIEVLVTLLVIAIGVLGMAGLHSRSLQYQQAAYIQSQATFLASDMLDRIQANRAQARTSNLYQVGLNQSVYSQCLQKDYPDSCETGGCTPEQLAVYDVLQWKFQLTCQLPGSQGSVSYSDSSDGRVYIITLSFPTGSKGVPVSDVVLRSVL
ncbi:MAG: type IV pilus modification protein PilV [Endozoicomonas sp.]